jgi:hypothetical protein
MAELDSSGFTFLTNPTKAETERFEFVEFEYIQDNPGTVNDVFVAAIGVYYNDDGDTT